MKIVRMERPSTACPQIGLPSLPGPQEFRPFRRPTVKLAHLPWYKKREGQRDGANEHCSAGLGNMVTLVGKVTAGLDVS
jgi:hypothetical protein